MDRNQFFKKHVPEVGWVYQTGFDGKTVEESLLKLKEFLKTEGLGDIPIPETARRLWWDYLRPDEDGNFGRFLASCYHFTRSLPAQRVSY